MNVIISEAADEDLFYLALDGLENFGIENSDKYVKGIKENILKIADFPLSNPEASEIKDGVRFSLYRSHVILYKVIGDNILIIRIRHQREDWR